MNPNSTKTDYFKKVASNFIATYCKQFKKCRDYQHVNTHYIKESIHPLLKTISSYSVLGDFWPGVI